MTYQFDKLLTDSQIDHLLSLTEIIGQRGYGVEPFKRFSYYIPLNAHNTEDIFAAFNNAFTLATGRNDKVDRLYLLEFVVGSYMTPHSDVWTNNRAAKREYTLVIQLSDPSDYTGGSTLVYEDENNPITSSKEKGSGILYQATTLHEVTPITEGKRYSIAGAFDRQSDKLL